MGSDNKNWAETDGTGDRKGAWGLRGKLGELVALAGTLILLLCCPAVAIYMWFVLTKLNGSIEEAVQFSAGNRLQGWWEVWPRPSAEAWTIIASFGAFEALLLLALPGKKFSGPVTPKGNTPVYKANGVQAYFVTLVAFGLGWRYGVFNPARVYDLFGEILAALNIFSLLLCLFLFIKGHLAPSTSDSGTTGSLVYDFYWGLDLYPRIGKHFDIKTWTNCRMGMMGWAVLALCYVVKQRELYGAVSESLLVSVVLMLTYIFKFFLWETGYWGSMDIMHDRAGYYLCWGCLVWVPSIYTSPALYLVEHPTPLGTPLALGLTLAGLLCIFINYDSDRQRQMFRAKGGKLLIWGKKPKVIEATYFTGDGKKKKSLLLASGWWGLARHFHYLPEIMASFFWTSPALFSRPLPYFYVFYLTLLLTDRAFRDDTRCASKYGKFWEQYKKLVPSRMVPFLF